MVYVEQKHSLEGIEFDDEREIISQIFNSYEINQPDELDYLNPLLTQRGNALNLMPEVYRVTRVLSSEQGLL